jgi:hypothetical protein
MRESVAFKNSLICNEARQQSSNRRLGKHDQPTRRQPRERMRAEVFQRWRGGQGWPLATAKRLGLDALGTSTLQERGAGKGFTRIPCAPCHVANAGVSSGGCAPAGRAALRRQQVAAAKLLSAESSSGRNLTRFLPHRDFNNEIRCGGRRLSTGGEGRPC